VLPVRYELGFISQKMIFFTVTTVKASNLSQLTQYLSSHISVPKRVFIDRVTPTGTQVYSVGILNPSLQLEVLSLSPVQWKYHEIHSQETTSFSDFGSFSGIKTFQQSNRENIFDKGRRA
jgi:hypothetical protein